MSDRKSLGRVVPTWEEPTRKIATVSVRPQRLAFLVREGFPSDELVRLIRYNTTVWGGMFNALIPTDGVTLLDGWWDVLQSHNPDVIVLCGNIKNKLTQEIVARLQPLRVHTWESFYSEEPVRIDRSNNISVLSILAYALEQSTSESRFNSCIPLVNPDHPFFQYAIAQFGALDDNYRQIYTQKLQAEVVDLETVTDIGSYLNIVSRILRRRYPLWITTLELDELVIEASGIDGRIIIVLGGDNYLRDLCAFWALRMSPAFGQKDTLFLPIEAFQSRRNLKCLAEWCNQRLIGTNFVVVASSSVNRRRLLSFRDRLARLLRDEVKFVDLRVSHFIVGQFRVLHETKQMELMWEGNRTRIHRPLPRFDRHLRTTSTWIIDLDLADPLRQQNGFIPPGFPHLNDILNGKPDRRLLSVSGYWIRKAQGVLSRRVSKSRLNEFIDVRLPSEEALFEELLKTAGYQPEMTEKCRYVTGMTKLLSNAGAMDLLKQPHLRQLFRSMANRKAYDLNGIFGLTRCPKERKEEFRNILNELALHGCLLRGYRLRCPACNLDAWYPLGQLSETISCMGCLTVFQPPFNAQFSYRLNRLIEVGMEQGAIPVILTMMLLKGLSKRSFLHVPGIKAIREDTEVDLDILASCDGHLIVAECKQLEDGYGDETAEKVATRFRKEYQVAREIGAEIVFLSMMTNEKHPTITQVIEELNAGEGPAVHLLLLDDLERGSLLKPAETTDTIESSEEPKKATLWDLLPTKRSSEQGWIRKPGPRTISF